MQKQKLTNKVLVVDDDQHIRDLVQAIIEIEGFEVEIAKNGEEAIEILANETIVEELKFIILDVLMPKMNGFQVLENISSNPKINEIPIIMLTAEDRDGDIMEGYKKGASYYVTKPFTRDQLLYGIELVVE